jgi:S-formylglutathione hydrolase
VPWGVKAFTAYLGEDRTQWAGYDATALMARSATPPYPGGILIEQGMADKFLATQLRPEAFEAACDQAQQPLTLLRHEGYDHGYYFIATFIEDHLRFHFEQAGQSVPMESQASR